MDVALVALRVMEYLLNGLECAAEEILAGLLEACTGNRGVEVNTLVDRVDFDGGLGCRRKDTLSTFASGTVTPECARVQ